MESPIRPGKKTRRPELSDFEDEELPLPKTRGRHKEETKPILIYRNILVVSIVCFCIFCLSRYTLQSTEDRLILVNKDYIDQMWQNCTEICKPLLQKYTDAESMRNFVLTRSTEAKTLQSQANSSLEKEKYIGTCKTSQHDIEEYWNSFHYNDDKLCEARNESSSLELKHQVMEIKLRSIETSALKLDNKLSDIENESSSSKEICLSPFQRIHLESAQIFEKVKFDCSSAIKLSVTTYDLQQMVLKIQKQLDDMQLAISDIKPLVYASTTLVPPAPSQQIDLIEDIKTIYNSEIFLPLLLILSVIFTLVVSVSYMSYRKFRCIVKYYESYERDMAELKENVNILADATATKDRVITELQDRVNILIEAIGIKDEPLIKFYCARNMADLEEILNILIEAIRIKDEPLMKFEFLRILYKVDIEQPLQDKFCIISFNSQTAGDHEHYIDPCLAGRSRVLGYGKEKFVVESPEDVLKIPKCKVMLVFVDNNNADMILETPGIDGNVLRLLTVKSCRKMRADVFVIYIGDVESATLMPMLLYNSHIAAVTEHFLLKKLEKEDRVLTCNKELTNDQKEKISELII